MTDTLEQIGRLLHEAGETHHRVFRVAAAWEAAVRSSFTTIRAEAERRAGPGPATS